MNKAYAVVAVNKATGNVEVLAVYSEDLMNDAYDKRTEAYNGMFPKEEYDISIEETLYCY